jgi:hypothetical protein
MGGFHVYRTGIRLGEMYPDKVAKSKLINSTAMTTTDMDKVLTYPVIMTDLAGNMRLIKQEADLEPLKTPETRLSEWLENRSYCQSP